MFLVIIIFTSVIRRSTMKIEKQFLKKHTLLIAILLAFIFSFSISCGTQEEAGMEPEQKAQEETPQVQERIQELETEIEQKNEAIAELEEQTSQIEAQVPVFREVMQGDSHIEYADGGQSADVLLLNQDKFRMARLIIFIN